MRLSSRFTSAFGRRAAIAAVAILTIATMSAAPSTAQAATTPSTLATPQCTDAVQMINSGAGPLVWVPVGPGSVSPCWMLEGNVSRGVWALQRALNACFSMGLSEDWQFGPKTKAALKTVQGRIGAIADGGYGPDTYGNFGFKFSNANSSDGRPCGRP
ncbi:peptidoglycan-binding domain-containing protein [Catenuloplanes japonicus]|uniref:peptidoglycan-binding domain-containing protein n=1 Tax=Catenuloplanes japonicus TaxID=33876 RepID=UPI000A0FF12D|nr:peptidoglycan-binding domain-containing protein [Catenuloplanes japonicus]